MAQNELFNELIDKSANRRSFVKKLGLASAALGAVAATPGAAQTTYADSDILNFALNLEYLEAEFYTFATTGMSITQLGTSSSGSTGQGGATTGGSQVNFGTNTAIQNIALELANDERTHVTLLQNAIAGLGAASVTKPAINLNALGFGFGSVSDFLKLARIFEDIGVTAYGGAAPLIVNKTILGYAARILAVEALHAGGIRAQIANLGISTFPPLDGADHLPPPSGGEYFTTDSMALSEVRSPGQVLYLAYGAAGVSSGGFFPSGVNGIFNTSATASANTDGAYITASPNPISVAAGTDGVATISWYAPSPTQVIQVRVGSPTGALFTDNGPSGSMTTGAWLTDGTVLYLQDVTKGAASSQNTLASVVIHVAGH